MQEIDELEYKIKEEISKELIDISKVVYSSRYLEIYERLIKNEIDTNKLANWHVNKEKAYKTMEHIAGKLSAVNYFKENKEQIQEAEDNMKEFYQKAEKRNEVMVRNMLNKLRITRQLSFLRSRCHSERKPDKVRPKPRNLNKSQNEMSRQARHDSSTCHSCSPSCHSCEGRNPDSCIRHFVIPSPRLLEGKLSRGISTKTKTKPNKSISNYNYPCGIIVAGGYHAKGIKEILRSKGISYEVIIPKITQTYDKGRYLERVKEQAQWLSKECYNVKAKKEEAMQSHKTLERKTGLSDKLELISLLGTTDGIKEINRIIKEIELSETKTGQNGIIKLEKVIQGLKELNK
ncbi:furin-like repeat-containing protein, partial [bacterium]